jgi:predicted DCC family thiol-disulfide oxidoreductase YuxK
VRREPLNVLYDGTCSMCTRWMAWALARDRDNMLVAIPLQSDEALQFGIERSRLMRELHVVGESEGVRNGADAVAAVFSRLPGWGWLARLMRLPLARQIARVVYRRIAGRRGRPTMA